MTFKKNSYDIGHRLYGELKKLSTCTEQYILAHPEYFRRLTKRWGRYDYKILNPWATEGAKEHLIKVVAKTVTYYETQVWTKFL